MTSSTPRRRSVPVTAVVGIAALLVSCAPAVPEPPEPAPRTPSTTAPLPASESPPEPVPELASLAPVDCATAGRPPSEIESTLLVEPGTFSGSSFDAAAVLRALGEPPLAQLEQWATQTHVLIQEDYADAVCGLMTFSADLGEGEPQPEDTTSEEQEEAPVGRNHFALVFDASGSMAARSGSTTRMAAAKEALASFVSGLPADATVSVRVYGHEGNNTDAARQESCASSELVFQGSADVKALNAGIAAVEATGWTPLARAITDAAGDIPPGTTDGIVYVVTDGIETCGGDPVLAASELAATGVSPIVNVIGFETGDADTAALRAIADAGGGAFTRVGSAAELQRHWAQEHRRMAEAWRVWRQQEIARVEAESRENARVSGELIGTVNELVKLERTHSEEVFALIESEGAVPDDELSTLRWALSDRIRDIRNYAGDTARQNTSAILAAKARAWSEAYDTATEKWSEHYAKADGDG